MLSVGASPSAAGGWPSTPAMLSPRRASLCRTGRAAETHWTYCKKQGLTTLEVSNTIQTSLLPWLRVAAPVPELAGRWRLLVPARRLFLRHSQDIKDSALLVPWNWSTKHVSIVQSTAAPVTTISDMLIILFDISELLFAFAPGTFCHVSTAETYNSLLNEIKSLIGLDFTQPARLQDCCYGGPSMSTVRSTVYSYAYRWAARKKSSIYIRHCTFPTWQNWGRVPNIIIGYCIPDRNKRYFLHYHQSNRSARKLAGAILT